MKPWKPLLALTALAVVSGLHFRLILESIVSLFGSIALSVSSPDSQIIDWSSWLLEFRMAAGVWLGAAFILVSVVVRRNRKLFAMFSRETLAQYRPPLAVMVALAFVSLTCPFLTPVEPEIQGDLTHTRLLPPFSMGSIVEEVPSPSSMAVTPLERRVSAANRYLVKKSVYVTSGVERGSRADSGERSVIFLCGTDDSGRDVFSRMVYGTRVSFSIGLLSAIGAMLLGGFIGICAGLSRGMLDGMLMRLTDLMLSVPGIFIIIGFMAFLDQSPGVIVLVLSLTGWMHTARIVRSETMALRDREYVLAARMLHVSGHRIVLRHILPNLSPILWTAFVLQFANAVLGEATLGFLGFGIQPPTATWGNMLGEGTTYLGSAWWLSFFPGLILAAVLIRMNTISSPPRETGSHLPNLSGISPEIRRT